MRVIVNNGKVRVSFGAPKAEGAFVLQPGSNKVDSAAWAEASKSPVIAALTKSGTLVDVTDGKAGKKSEEPDHVTAAMVEKFGGLSVKKALHAVEKATDKDVLRACLKVETREEVAEAISARLEELS